jgi:hypothetical protein
MFSFHASKTTLKHFLSGQENDFLHVARALETNLDFITETRLLCYHSLFQALDFFAYMGDLELLTVVGRALINLCEKYLGPSSRYSRQGIGTTIVAYYVDNPKKNVYWRNSEDRACSAAQKSLRTRRLQSLAATIVRNLESL